MIHVKISPSHWSETNVNTGDSYNDAGRLKSESGATANSSSVAYVRPSFIAIAQTVYYIDYSGNIKWLFNFACNTSDANALRRFQLKQNNGVGVLAQTGIGIEIQNLDVHGESYATARSTVDLSTTLTAEKQYQAMILHYPATPKVEFWLDVDGNGLALKGSITTSANIPQAVSTGDIYLCQTIENGASAVGVGINSGFHDLWFAR